MSESWSPHPRLAEFLHAAGLIPADAATHWTPLTGGVSSDIWRVDAAGKSLCVKCALPKLKVAGDWQAPTVRNTYEWEWLQFASRTVPGSTPGLLAHDPELGAFAMEYLDPARHPVWKQQLLDGDIHPVIASRVAAVLARLHQASTQEASLAERFRTDDIFYSIRLEPYLEATGRAHPRLRATLHQLLETTLGIHAALVHGDVSPKNILVGSQHVVFLDAECAWFGDPAFDVAFCLNHFLLKSVRRPADAPRLLDAYRSFRSTYFSQVRWESPKSLEARTAGLLPALFLARVDGKSPVEYLTREADQNRVRQLAIPMLETPPSSLGQIEETCRKALMPDTSSERHHD